LINTMSKPIYLDYNATTPIDPEVAKAMEPFLYERFGNPSSMHAYGAVTRTAVENARQQVASLLNCHTDEIVFTSGGTESNNMALKGVAFANRFRGNHIITSSVEHPAVIEVYKYLQKHGFRVTFLPVNIYGIVTSEEVAKAIDGDTILVSIMHANNEVGSIQPIKEIAEVCKTRDIIFHSDAAQSIGKVHCDVEDLGIDLLSIAGHKLYAPKGIGVLYISRGTVLEKFIHGADHESDRRAGTENVLEIVGLGKACELAEVNLRNNIKHMMDLRDLLYRELLEQDLDIRLNGHPADRLPNTLSVGFKNMEASEILQNLDTVAASAGAACHTGEDDGSSVLSAMKVPEAYAMGTIRFSTGKYNTREEIIEAAKAIGIVVKNLSSEA